MDLSGLDPSSFQYQTSEGVFDDLRSVCEANPDLAHFQVIGQSEEGRPIAGMTLGYGRKTVTLVAGAHADEPVGPETLRTFVLEGLAARDWLAEGDGMKSLFEEFTFKIVPHVNPDGEARNQEWISQWPSLEAYLSHRVRELPGQDIEFGYPVMRSENRAVSRFLFDYEPISLHMSLHGMGIAEGALLLLEKEWAENVPNLKSDFAEVTASAGLRLHDQDRGGDKGFRYYGPGFWSTPEGRAMRKHFVEAGDSRTAGKFFLSSMEMAIQTGLDPVTGRTPLCLVTELPLFYLAAAYDHEPGIPSLFNRFKEEINSLTIAARRGEDLSERIAPYDVRAVDLETAVRLQLKTIELGLAAAG